MAGNTRMILYCENIKVANPCPAILQLTHFYIELFQISKSRIVLKITKKKLIMDLQYIWEQGPSPD